MSPSRLTDVGSPTRHKSGCSPAARMCSISATVPWIAAPSSSPVMMKLSVPALTGIVAAAATIAAIEPFMSTAPRPYSSSPRRSGRNGALVQPWPGGTTSRCPAKAKWRLPFGPRRTA